MNVKPEIKNIKVEKKKKNFLTFRHEKKRDSILSEVLLDMLIDAPLFLLRLLWESVELIFKLLWIIIRGIGHVIHHFFDHVT